ncbi:MAG: Ppx/GppA family phosphatase [Leptospiraceae bacterium]|nr:Ppx/GppA family phosphatase [Leptospiraceae bacterium]MCB1314704.1 Ppx/GppA family phosphatase [Leptospiraceae bacterium]
MKSKNIAAIDLGTNSFHLVIVRPGDRYQFDVIGKSKEEVRLGSGGGDLDHIGEEAMERGIEALSRFMQLARGHQATVRAVATSALREAHNRDAFLERARKECGLNIEIIPGREEARLIYLGALQALPVFDRQTLLVDIGGGSTEFVIGKSGQPLYAVSLKLGAIRLNDRFFAGDSINANRVQECRRYIRVALAGVAADIAKQGFELAVGCSGTIETLAEMVRQTDPDGGDARLKEAELNPETLAATTEKILSIGEHKKRARLPGLDEKRADIIVPGAILLDEIFQALRVQRMVVSPYALREGVIMDTLIRASNRKEMIADIRRDSVRYLAESMLGRNTREWKATQHITFLAGRLLDHLMTANILRGLTLNDSFLLQSASLLHNVGTIIAHSAHHKHSYYIIKNSESLMGFTPLELEIIAQVARYHRKSAPSRKHSDFQSLPRPEQDQVRKLAGVLRVAVNLERGSEQRVKDLQLVLDQKQRTIRILVEPDKQRGKPVNVSLEIWAARSMTALLEEVTNRHIEIEAVTGTDGD